MADVEYFDIPGEGKYPNREEAVNAARTIAKGTDKLLEIYRVRRTLVKTVQRSVSLQEADVPTA